MAPHPGISLVASFQVQQKAHPGLNVILSRAGAFESEIWIPMKKSVLAIAES